MGKSRSSIRVFDLCTGHVNAKMSFETYMCTSSEEALGDVSRYSVLEAALQPHSEVTWCM